MVHQYIWGLEDQGVAFSVLRRAWLEEGRDSRRRSSNRWCIGVVYYCKWAELVDQWSTGGVVKE